jgi:hypothetical protein
MEHFTQQGSSEHGAFHAQSHWTHTINQYRCTMCTNLKMEALHRIWNVGGHTGILMPEVY